MPFRGVLALRHASATLSGPRKGERKTAILFLPLDLAGLRNDILLPRHYNAFSAQVSVAYMAASLLPLFALVLVTLHVGDAASVAPALRGAPGAA